MTLSNDSLKAKKQELLKLMLKKKGISFEHQVISKRDQSESVPLSFSQQRLWFLDQLEGDKSTYNIPAALQLSGKLNLNALEQSLQEIVNRHEVLRTSFQVVNDDPVQVVDSSVNLSLNVVDLQSISTHEQTVEVERLISLEVATPFDISIAPLFRVKLIILSEISHVLVLNLHHIVSDGWSVGVFVQELSTLYTAFSEGKPSPLPPLEIQYADFAVWQRKYLSGDVLNQKLAYWQENLAGANPLLELPTFPRPPIQTYHGQTFKQTLNAEITQKIKSLAQETGITLFITLQAAFVVLLHRYSGQTDIVLGTPVANRERQEIEPLIGFFVNTLVLRNQINDNSSFGEFLKQVQKTTLDGFSHQDIPFEQVVEALQTERNLSYSPLFQVMFALQNTPESDLELSGLKISSVQMETVTAKFDLTLSMEEVGEQLVGMWEYNTDLFDQQTIERMSAHFQNILTAIISNPQQLIADLPLLNESESEQILVNWNQTQAEYPQNLCLHQLFEQQVARTPDHIAVIAGEEKLTYKELNDRANQLAYYLQNLGVKSDSLVGICVERSLEMVVGLLGILKAGGAYVPLDPEYPIERLEYMIQDAQISVLLTQQNLLTSLSKQEAQIICLDQDWQLITDFDHGDLSIQSEQSPQDLAYVIYTSGSTGKPKGVMIPHSAIVNHMVWMNNTFPLDENDQVLQKTPFSFDAATWEFYAPLLAGAKLVMAEPGGHRDSKYLIDIINQHKITTIQLVPSLLRMLVGAENFASCQSLKRVFCGGEVLNQDLVKQCQNQIEAEIYNLYGPTETTIDATYFKCQTANFINSRTVPIGRPIANTQIYLLDQNLQPVPVGVPGEICISGDGLARGYLHRPDLTAAKFIQNPFGNGYLYKTGDIGRYLVNGNIEYLHRADYQVKLRGFRIELGEIENAIAQYPQVQQVAAIVREDQPGDQRLVAYIITNEENINYQDLRNYLKSQLPEYMIPSAFVGLETLPLKGATTEL